MSLIKERKNKKRQWFFEKSVPYDQLKIKIGIEIKEKLYSGQSPYQKIELFDTYDFGKILVLDGILQASEKDEFIYHEMLVHPAMFYHSNPKKVLIIGGGDGGALREVLKHPIQEVYLVDIDKKVIEISQKYLPFMSKGAFKNKKAKIFIEDGIKFIKKYHDFFDLVILDLSDPDGPAKKLITLRFYQDVKKALKKNGIVSIQNGSLTCQPKLVSIIYKRIKKVFSFVKIYKAVVPSYQDGEYSFIVASDFNLEKTILQEIKKRFKKLNPVRFTSQLSNKVNLDLKYYSPEIHFASTILPRYLKERLK